MSNVCFVLINKAILHLNTFFFLIQAANYDAREDASSENQTLHYVFVHDKMEIHKVSYVIFFSKEMISIICSIDRNTLQSAVTR